MTALQPTFPTRILHPALGKLLRFQARASLRRLGRGFATRRKLVLSCLGLVLAVIWVGNVALSILLREPTDPARLRSLIPIGLMIYGLWHVLKVAHKRPEEAIEWTPAERELLGGGPFRQSELIAYRLGGILSSAVLKAACFSLLMLPDLRLPGVGFIGVLAALLFLDLMRMTVEIAAWGASPRGFRCFRTPVLLAALAAGISTIVIALSAPNRPADSLALALRMGQSASELRGTWVGAVCEAPFHVFGNVISAEHLSWQLAGWMTLAVSMVGSMAMLVVWVNARVARAVVEREQRQYADRHATVDTLAAAGTDRDTLGLGEGETVAGAGGWKPAVKLPRVPRGWGLPLAWRQSMGAWRYVGSVLMALVAPALLSCLPLVVCHDPRLALVNVVGALAFYSFLLLPCALKFDFRRDVERMALLKSLPLRPSTVVVGQLATPVAITFALQCAVLAVTALVRPVPLSLLAGAALLLLPLNIWIFALDNLIFLLYPHRLQEEGIQIFLRTTLAFTAKSLLFAGGAVLALGWAYLAGRVAISPGGLEPISNEGPGLFIFGIAVMLVATALVTTWLLVRTYARFDASQDIPG